MMDTCCFEAHSNSLFSWNFESIFENNVMLWSVRSEEFRLPNMLVFWFLSSKNRLPCLVNVVRLFTIFRSFVIKIDTEVKIGQVIYVLYSINYLILSLF
jgi:hypothetical protein